LAKGRKTDLRIGLDSGGTFTDLVIQSGGRLTVRKVPSTPADPTQAIMRGLADFLPARQALIIHGTTVGTNALLEKRAAVLPLSPLPGLKILFLSAAKRVNIYTA